MTTDKLQRLLFDGMFKVAAQEADKVEQAQKKREKKPEPKQAQVIQFPFWPEPERAAPNALLRSALFGVVKRGERRYCELEEFPSWAGTTLKYTGKQLDQYDEDVWLQLVHLHHLQGVPPGGKVTFTGRGFLKGLGRSYGRDTRECLYRSLTRLEACAVSLTFFIEGRECEYLSSLVQKAFREKGSERWVVILDPDLLQFFAPGHYSRIDWDTRLALSTDLAKWLHGYVATHEATAKHPHRIGVERLRELCGMRTELKRFRQHLKLTASQLERVGVIASWSITAGDALEFARPPRPRKDLSKGD